MGGGRGEIRNEGREVESEPDVMDSYICEWTGLMGC